MWYHIRRIGAVFPGGIRAIVAQLDRAFGSDPEGQRFESSRSHQKGMAQCAMPFSSCLFGVPSRRGTQRAYLRVLRAEGQVQCAIFSQRGLEFLAGQRPHLRRQMGQSPTEYRTKARNGG